MSDTDTPGFVTSDSREALYDHLDTWAAGINEPGRWGELIEIMDQWLDVSPRNQVVLASFGVATPVAGSGTWETIPSSEPGRGCAVRAGEQACWIRVPVVDGTDRPIGSARSPTSGARSRTQASGFEWVPVFAQEQLVRRPAPGVLRSPTPPEIDDKQWADKARLATRNALGGYPPRAKAPDAALREAATKLCHDESNLGAQAAWLVESRFHRTSATLPPVDPAAMTPRERWQAMVEIRAAVTHLVGELGRRLDVDLLAGPIPRIGSDDTRIAPGRRNYLSNAELAAMATGVWQEVGPYTAREWQARGRSGVVGRAGFIKATERSYIAIYEQSDGWRWALETVGRGQHRGLWAEGTAPTLASARTAAHSEIESRWPNVAASISAPTPGSVVAPSAGWTKVTGDQRDTRTEHRAFDNRITAMITPGPGGRWSSFVLVDGTTRDEGPLEATRDAAAQTAERLAAATIRQLHDIVPTRPDDVLSQQARQPGWSRQHLIDLIGPALLNGNDAELATAEPHRLVELLGASGRVNPETIVEILRAEDVTVDQAVELLDGIGLGRPQGVAAISQAWSKPLQNVAQLAGLTSAEFATLGPTPQQLLAFDPDAALRTNGPEPADWYKAGIDLISNGCDPIDALRLVATNAPTPESIASGLYGITEDLHLAVTIAGPLVTPDELVVIGSVYVADSTTLLATIEGAGLGRPVAVHVALSLTDNNTDQAYKLIDNAARSTGTEMMSQQTLDELAQGRTPTTNTFDANIDSNVISVNFAGIQR